MIHDRVKSFPCGRLLGQTPGLRIVDVLVHTAHQTPQLRQCAVHLKSLQMPLHTGDDLSSELLQSEIDRGRCARLRHHAVTKPLEHGEATMQRVAQIIGQISVYPFHQSSTRVFGVLTETDFAQQEVADGIGSKLIDELIGIDYVTL